MLDSAIDPEYKFEALRFFGLQQNICLSINSAKSLSTGGQKYILSSAETNAQHLTLNKNWNINLPHIK